MHTHHICRGILVVVDMPPSFELVALVEEAGLVLGGRVPVAYIVIV